MALPHSALLLLLLLLLLLTSFTTSIVAKKQYAGTQLTVIISLEIYGDIRIKTVPQDAFPRATAIFLSNVRRRLYDHCVLYRSDFFVLQGGECTNHDESNRPPHMLHTKTPASLTPPEWNPDFPAIEGSVALAGDPASMHFFFNLIDRTEWSSSFKNGVRSEPTIGHVYREDMHLIHTIRAMHPTTDTHQNHGKVEGMTFLDTPIRIKRAYVLEDEMKQATKTFLITLKTQIGNIVMRTIPSNTKTVNLFKHNCQHYYASPPGGCVFYRAEKDSLLMAGECRGYEEHNNPLHVLPSGPEVKPTEFDSTWENVEGMVTVTGEEKANEYFFINVANNSNWIKRAVVATVEKGWHVVKRMVNMPTQRTHPKTGADLKMSFLKTPIRILGCEVKPSKISTPSPIVSSTSSSSSTSSFTSLSSKTIPLMVSYPMKYQRLGATELKVSILGLGTHQFGDPERVSSVLHAAILIQTAFDLGINVIDTSELYPCDGQTFGCLGKQAEIMIGQALKRIQNQNDKFDRDDIIIISKILNDMSDTPNSKGLSRKRIITGCRRSLERLAVTYIDVYFAHGDDLFISMETIVRAFNFLIQQGHILHWAVSNWTIERIILAMNIAKQYHLIPPMVSQDFRNPGIEEQYQLKKKILDQYDIGAMVYGASYFGGDLWNDINRRAKEISVSSRSVASAMVLEGGVMGLTAPSTVNQLLTSTREVLHVLSLKGE